MKPASAILNFVFIAVIIVLAVSKWRQSREQTARIAQLEASAQEQERTLATYKASIEKLQKTRSDLTRDLHDLSSQSALSQNAQPGIGAVPASSPAADTNAPQKEKQGMGGFLSSMMEDPDMRRMMLQQQKTVMETMYAPLFKQLGLTPEETEKFNQLILTNQMRNMERGAQVMKGMEDPANRAATMEKVTQQQKESEEEMKAFLGEERFAQYREYNESMGDRMALQQFKQQMMNATPLRDDQEFQLQRMMKEEAKNIPPAGADANESLEMRSWSVMVSEEAMDKHFKRQEEINQRVLERARTVLSEEQLAHFGKFQENQVNMQKVGLNMARKMMGPAKQAEPLQPQN